MEADRYQDIHLRREGGREVDQGIREERQREGGHFRNEGYRGQDLGAKEIMRWVEERRELEDWAT